MHSQPAQLARQSLTVVMPCLNEEKNVGDAARATLRAFDHYGIDGELLIVNDGSSDGTQNVIDELARLDARVRPLWHEVRQGIGASFHHGVREARKELVTWLPGDNENDPLESLMYLALARDVDIIVPFIHNVEIRSRFRRIVSSTFRFLINVSFGMNLNYTNGMVIYNTAILREIDVSSKGFFYQAEMLIKLIRRGYLYAETPQFLIGRQSGKTKAISLRSMREVAMAYLRMVVEIHILRSSGTTGQPLHPASATYRRLAGK